MTRMKIYGAKGRLAPPVKKKGSLSDSGSFKIVSRPRKSWFARFMGMIWELFGGRQSRTYARANKALNKQSKANIHRADQLQKKVGRVRERK